MYLWRRISLLQFLHGGFSSKVSGFYNVVLLECSTLQLSINQSMVFVCASAASWKSVRTYNILVYIWWGEGPTYSHEYHHIFIDGMDASAAILPRSSIASRPLPRPRNINENQIKSLNKEVNTTNEYTHRKNPVFAFQLTGGGANDMCGTYHRHHHSREHHHPEDVCHPPQPGRCLWTVSTFIYLSY